MLPNGRTTTYVSSYSMNVGLSSRLHPRKSSFLLSWSAGASATGTMKAQDTKKAFKLPCHKAESKSFQNATNLVSKRVKFNVDLENNWLFRKTSVRDAFSLPDSPQIAQICL